MFLTKKTRKTKTIINVIIFSIIKYVEFNDIMTQKLIIINKHIYAILNQNVNLNKLLNETQL